MSLCHYVSTYLMEYSMVTVELIFSHDVSIYFTFRGPKHPKDPPPGSYRVKKKLISYCRHAKMCDPCNLDSEKFLDNCMNFLPKSNKKVVFNKNKTSFVLKMMK